MTSDLWFASALLPGGWADAVRITLADGLIRTVTPNAPAEDAERHGPAIPGLPNLHSHAFQRGMAGLTETRAAAGVADDFWTWRALMYRFLDVLTPEDVEAIAALAYAEMLESGFTRVGEFHYLHHQPDGTPYDNPGELAARIAAAAEMTGIGLTLLPAFYAAGGFGGLPCAPGQRRFAAGPDLYARLMDASRAAIAPLPAARIGIAPHSLRAAPLDQLAAVLPLAEDGLVHIHVAEQTREVADCLAWSGQRPVELLLERAPVDHRWCLIHATHVTEDECARLAASGAVAGLCPITEADLGDGVFPAVAYHRAGGRFGVGSDSNVDIDAPGELRLLEWGQRLTLRGRNLMAAVGGSTGRCLFDAALAGGSQALGVATFELVAGAPADFVTLSPDHPGLIGRAGDRLLDSWIFGRSAAMVDGVWRHGRRLVAEGRHIHHAAITRRYRATLSRLLAAGA